MLQLLCQNHADFLFDWFLTAVPVTVFADTPSDGFLFYIRKAGDAEKTLIFRAAVPFGTAAMSRFGIRNGTPAQMFYLKMREMVFTILKMLFRSFCLISLAAECQWRQCTAI